MNIKTIISPLFLILLFPAIMAATLADSTELTLSVNISHESCSGSKNGYINLTVKGGTPPYTYSWSNDATSEDLESLSAGKYTVTVKDNAGKKAKISAEVDEFSCKIFPEIVFTPNNDGINDTWLIEDLLAYKSFVLTVYNRWGQKVRSWEDSYEPWDGSTITGAAPAGSYYYVFSPNKEKQNKNVSKGVITIVR